MDEDMCWLLKAFSRCLLLTRLDSCLKDNHTYSSILYLQFLFENFAVKSSNVDKVPTHGNDNYVEEKLFIFLVLIMRMTLRPLFLNIKLSRFCMKLVLLV